MKALKGLLSYIGIVLASILGIAIILFAIMYFVPSFRIYGVGVVHDGKKEEGTAVDISNYSGFTEIELNISSKKVSVYLDNAESDSKINYIFTKNVFGIAFDITEYKVLKDVELKGTTLKVNIIVTEPEGWISSNSSSISITLPQSFNYSLMANTTSGKVVLGKSSEMSNIKNLTINTTSGGFTFGTTKEEGTTTTKTLNTLNLSTKSGLYDLSSIDNLTCNNTIKLEGENGTFKFKNVNASLNATGKGIKLDADEIVTDINGFKFISENGFFQIGKINTMAGAENTIVTENCDVKIDEVLGKTGIVTTYGNINIGILNDYATLQSEHGSVTIKKAKSDLIISTTFGNITVEGYESNGKFVSKRGNINVKSTGDYRQGVYTSIENTDGSIVVDNKVNRLLVKTYGSSKVEIKYREIKGGLDPVNVFQHKVNLADSSSATVYMPTVNYNTPFKFIAKGNISGEISGLVPEYGGDKVKSSDDFQYFPEKSVKDECMTSCYFEFLGTIYFQGYLNV